MDLKSPRKSDGKAFAKPKVLGKNPGKIALGFQSFKLINSNIKLVKQVDVKTSLIKSKITPDANNSVPAPPTSLSTTTKVGTVDALRQLREKFQTKKKLHEELSGNTSDIETALPNGLPKKETDKVELEKSSDSHEHEKKSPAKLHKSDGSPEKLSSPSSDRDKKPRSDSKPNRKLSLPESSVKRQYDGKTNNRPTSERPATSRDRSYKHHESRQPKDTLSSSRSPRRESKDTHSSKKTSSSDRSRSPLHKQSSSSSKRNLSSRERSKSPHHNKEGYSSSRTGSSHRSPHHSHRREKNSIRKYSASYQPRESEGLKSYFHSHGHRSDKRRSSHDDSKHDKRSSTQRKSTDHSTSSSSRKASESSQVDYSSSRSKRETRSPERSRKHSSSKSKSSPTVKEHQKPDSDGLFSKLSFDFSINEDEEYELDNGSSDYTPNQDAKRDVKPELDILKSNVTSTNGPLHDILVPPEQVVENKSTNAVDIFEDEESDEISPTSENNEIRPGDFRIHSLDNDSESNSGGDTPCQDELDSDGLAHLEKMNSDSNRDSARETTPVLDEPPSPPSAVISVIKRQSASPPSGPLLVDNFSLNNDGTSSLPTSVNSMVVDSEVPSEQDSPEMDCIDIKTSVTMSKADGKVSSVKKIENSNSDFALHGITDELNSKNHNFNLKSPTTTSDMEKGKRQNCEEPSIYAEFPSPSQSAHLPSSSPNFESSNVSNTKIPVLSSQLKNIFKSIMETDFKSEEKEMISTITKLNGVVSINKTETVAEFHEFKTGNHIDTLNKNSHVAEKTKGGEGSGLKDTAVEDSLVTSKKSDMEVDAGICGSVVPVPQVVHESAPKTLDVPNLATHVSPDRILKASSYKLKLHATTRTPLPAKKSYIQQVQSDSESLVHQTGQQFSVDLNSIASSDGEHFVRTLSESVSQDDKTEVYTTKIDMEQMVPIKAESHCDEFTAASTIGLPRQDSSGSSTNENDEGPRRSARIRTKKTEKTLKKQVSVEPLQPLNNNLPIGTLEIDAESPSAISNQTFALKRNFKDLSGEELFKAKIQLAADVVDDCPEAFEVLEENLYLNSLKKSRARKEIRRMVCDCALEDNPDPGGPCGENCLNRLLMIECSSRCHYADKCSNKRFQHRIYAPTEVFKTSFKGWGIRAAADIQPGQLIMEYCGEVVDQREFTRRSMEYSKSNHAHFYFMALSQDEVIDATYKGNSSRFINHSCDPNAETQKWTVNGRLRVGFFTVKSIQKGDEITFDYQFERYGKVAQKCYCGTAKCRGYLGKAPDEDDENDTKLSRLLSNDALSPYDDTADGDLQEKDTRKKKKLSLFRDDTMEKDISKLLGGLRSSKEVLTLSRLMVRCETQAERTMCLQVLKQTTSQTRLKTFLQYHGLSIIWSWMVDISSVDDSDASALKLDIINTLCMLPITNKNIIEDSKVLSVVHRWAKPDNDGKASPEVEDVKPEEKSLLEGENTVTEEKTDPPSNESTVGTLVQDQSDQEPVATIIPTTDDATGNEEISKEVLHEDTSHDAIYESPKTNSKVLEAASSLLDSWKDLKEIYRIPKRQKPLPSPSRDSNSTSRDNSRTSSPQPKQSRSDDYDYKSGKISRLRRDSSQERWRDGWDMKYRDRMDYQFSPGSSNSGETRKEPGRRKRRFSTDSDDGSRESGQVPWHCRPPKFNSKMSREEYRRKFEQHVEKREQEKKRMEEQMEAEMAQNAIFPINSQQQFISNVGDIPSLMGQEIGITGQPMPGNATFTPSGFSGNLIQINPAQSAPLMVDPYMNVAQQVGLVQQVIQQPGQDPYAMQVQMQQGYDVAAIYNQDLSLQAGLPQGYSIQDPNLQSQQQINQMGQVIANPVGLIQPQQPMIQMQQAAVQQPPAQNNSNVTILGSQNGQAIVLLSAEQLQKLTQSDLSSLQQLLPSNADSSSGSSKQAKAKSKEKSKKDPRKLPRNWKTAKDEDGKTYYYHAISRQTQWNPPSPTSSEEDEAEKKSGGDDFSPSKLSTVTSKSSKGKNKGDGITDEGRKAKDAFRLKMSQFVVQCLSSFRKPDKKVGRITSTEAFKHLARKLTHNLMEKELKQVRVWEDLDFNANVQHKTKEYVKKYMSRVGPVYRIRDDT